MSFEDLQLAINRIAEIASNFIVLYKKINESSTAISNQYL